MRRFLSFLLALSLAGQASAAVAITDSVAFTEQGFGVENGVVPVNCTGSDRLVVFYVNLGENVGDATLTATHNGTPMLELWNDTGPSSFMRTAALYLVAPDSGAQNIAWSYTGGLADPFTSAACFSGVDQSAPLGTSQTNTVMSGTSVSVNVTAAAGDLVIDQMQSGQGPTTVPTAGAGQTEISTYRYVPGLGIIGGNSYESGTGTVAMSWTWSGNGNARVTAVPLKATSTPPPPTPSSGCAASDWATTVFPSTPSWSAYTLGTQTDGCSAWKD